MIKTTLELGAILMYYGIVYSVNDPAGKGVAGKLIEILGFRECSICRDAVTCYCGENYVLAGFKEDVIYFDFLDQRLPGEVTHYIVLSRHSSARKVKSYTVHHTGNPGPEAPYGGKPRSLAVASPCVTYTLLLLLRKYAVEYGRLGEYEVSYEATHHGPTEANKPLTFIEIGSTLEEWVDGINHLVLANAVMELLNKGLVKCKPVLGIGGGHYPRKHTRKAFEDGYCYGHIFAKYALQYLDKEILHQAIKRSEPAPQAIVVEKKGTRREHRVLIEGFASSHGLVVEYI